MGFSNALRREAVHAYSGRNGRLTPKCLRRSLIRSLLVNRTRLLVNNISRITASRTITEKSHFPDAHVALIAFELLLLQFRVRFDDNFMRRP